MEKEYIYIFNNLRKEKKRKGKERKGKERKSEIRVVVKLSAIYIYMYYKLRYYNNNNNTNFFFFTRWNEFIIFAVIDFAV